MHPRVAVFEGAASAPAECSTVHAPARLRVLCVESDLDHGHELQLHLAQNGINTTVSGDGAEGLLRAGMLRPGLALVGANVSGLPVRRLVELLRQTLEIPVIVGVGAGEAALAVEAMAAGPTACVPRPYDVGVLLPLIRSSHGTRTEPDAARETLRAGPLALDPAGHQVWLSGRALALPNREFRLLGHLMRHAGRVVTRTELHYEVWNHGEGFADNTITVHVRRLRRRLRAEDPAGSVAIHTVRGVGYRLDAV